jgi:hypothetical protein
MLTLSSQWILKPRKGPAFADQRAFCARPYTDKSTCLAVFKFVCFATMLASVLQHVFGSLPGEWIVIVAKICPLYNECDPIG